MAVVRHRSALQLEIQIVHPEPASVENQECVRHKDDALPWLKGQHGGLDVSREAQSRGCVGVTAVALQQCELIAPPQDSTCNLGGGFPRASSPKQ